MVQAFAEPWQQGTAAASAGQEASSADAAVPHAQISHQVAGLVEEQASYHAEKVPQQQHALAHPQGADVSSAVSEQQPTLAAPNERENIREGVMAHQNQGHHSANGTFDLPGSHFNDDDPSNPDGKLMSLLMG